MSSISTDPVPKPAPTIFGEPWQRWAKRLQDAIADPRRTSEVVKQLAQHRRGLGDISAVRPGTAAADEIFPYIRASIFALERPINEWLITQSERLAREPGGILNATGNGLNPQLRDQLLTQTVIEDGVARPLNAAERLILVFRAQLSSDRKVLQMAEKTLPTHNTIGIVWTELLEQIKILTQIHPNNDATTFFVDRAATPIDHIGAPFLNSHIFGRKLAKAIPEELVRYGIEPTIDRIAEEFVDGPLLPELLRINALYLIELDRYLTNCEPACVTKDLDVVERKSPHKALLPLFNGDVQRFQEVHLNLLDFEPTKLAFFKSPSGRRSASGRHTPEHLGVNFDLLKAISLFAGKPIGSLQVHPALYCPASVGRIVQRQFALTAIACRDDAVWGHAIREAQQNVTQRLEPLPASSRPVLEVAAPQDHGL